MIDAGLVAGGLSLFELAGAACGFECELDEHAATPTQTSAVMKIRPITRATRIDPPGACIDLHHTAKGRRDDRCSNRPPGVARRLFTLPGKEVPHASRVAS